MHAVKMKIHEWFVVVVLYMFSISDQTGSYGGQLAMHRRFEYKLSFKGPHLVQRDGTIPFWQHGGSKCYSLSIWIQTGPCHVSTPGQASKHPIFRFIWIFNIQGSDPHPSLSQ